MIMLEMFTKLPNFPRAAQFKRKTHAMNKRKMIGHLADESSKVKGGNL